jgi:DNA-binding LacI/PurR family transcriptional regulator
MENQGVILAHYPNPDEVYILSLEHAPADDFFFNILSSDPLAEGFMAGEHLMKKGWSRILCPLQDELSHTKNWVVQRLRGVKHAVDAGNGKAGYELIKGSSKNGELFEKITSLIKGSSERIGVAALTDELAAGILDFAEKHNLRAGKDYGLISFDDNPRYRSYNLTTVAPPRGKISSALADMMTDRKNTDGRIILKLKSTVIERTSC